MNPELFHLNVIATRAEQILLDFTDRFAVHGILDAGHLETFSLMTQALTRLTSIRKTLFALDKSTASTKSTVSTASTSLSTFLDLHAQAARLLGRWLDTLSLPLPESRFPACFEAVGCLHRLVSIHKTALLAPERIGPRDLDALHAVSALIQSLTGISLGPRTASSAISSPANAAAVQQPAINEQQTNAQPTTHNSQPTRHSPLTTRHLIVHSVHSVPAVPPVPALRACYLLTAPGAALRGVYQKISGLPGISPAPASPSSPGSAGALARSGSYRRPSAEADQDVRAPRIISSFKRSILNFNLSVLNFNLSVLNFDLSVLNSNLILPVPSFTATPPAASLPLRWPLRAAA